MNISLNSGKVILSPLDRLGTGRAQGTQRESLDLGEGAVPLNAMILNTNYTKFHKEILTVHMTT